jgi:hypothetical protein
MLASVSPDLRFALRTLCRARGFSLTAIATLAVGMSATSLVFTAINAVLLRPLPVADPDQLVAFSTAGEMAFLQQEPLAFADYQDIARGVPAFTSVIAHRRSASVIGSGIESRVALGEQVSANYFTALGLPLSVGRGFATEDDPKTVVVLSHTVWTQRFGQDVAILGRSIEIGGRARTVIGVAPAGFTGLFRGIAPEFWTPIPEAPVERAEARTLLQWWVHGRLFVGLR